MSSKNTENTFGDSKNNIISKIKRRNYYAYLLISFYSGFYSISDLALQFFFKDDLKLQPGVMSQVASIANIPWMIKPFLGLITDLVPICGYRRKYYILLMSLIISFSYIALSYHTQSLGESIILLFIVNFGVSFSTVIGEAIVVELSQLR